MKNKVVLPEGLFFVDLSEVGPAVYAGCCSFCCSLLHEFVFTSQYFASDLILLPLSTEKQLIKMQSSLEQIYTVIF